MKLLYAHLFALASPLLAAASQLIIKWQVLLAGPLPESLAGKLQFVVLFLFRPWVILALAATFFSGIAWIIAMTRLELSYAYPYVALPFILVPLAAAWLFQEQVHSNQFIGMALILLGIAVSLYRPG